MNQSHSESLIHVWNNCNHCGAEPIVGTRYECQTCPLGPDADFCASCHALIVGGQLAHPVTEHEKSDSLPHPFKAHAGRPMDPLLSWLQVPMVTAQSPTFADGFVLRPEFCAGYESTFAGYCFVVNVPGSACPTLLTALHVMEEMLRIKKVDASSENPAYTGRELPAVITTVNLYNVFAANWMISPMGCSGSMWVLPEARIRDEEPRSDRDIAAFKIPDPQGLVPGTLAQTVPEIGEPVWLCASRGGGHAQRNFAAVVVAKDEQSFIFRYLDNADGPAYSSGAPLINQAGEVVAINVGGGKLKGQRFGHGNHVLNIRAHLGGI